MTDANREQQRERLVELHSRWMTRRKPGEELVDFLLDNGITVEVSESIVCKTYPDCDREHAGGAGGVAVHPPAGSRISGDEPLLDDEQRCSLCGGVYPSPVELHHSEDECVKPGDVAIATVRAEVAEDDPPATIEVRGVFDRWGRLWGVRTDIGLGLRVDPEDITITSRAAVVTEADRDDLLDKLADAHVAPGWVARTIRKWFAERLGGRR